MFERISQDTIQQVKNYDGIVDYIQQYISLKKRGQNYIGLCPFHGEKTPSFTVSPQKQIFHCFGCHESGDLIAFAEKIDHLTFYEAIEAIATFANIDIIKEQVSQESRKKFSQLEKNLACYRNASESFYEFFKQSQHAQEYLKNRQLSEESINKFNLGYGGSSKELFSRCIDNGLSKEDLLASGLFSQGQSDIYCRFQQRLIFPIVDHQSRVVGFGGRLLDSNSQAAKYVNSEESLLFNKRKLLYGLVYAKMAIKQKKYILLVEGYMDVITCSQFGFDNVVACMGTSLTVDQINLIKRFTDRVVIMFDNDNAGQVATKRSIELLLEEEMRVDVVTLERYDPADFLIKYGKNALQEKIDSCISAFQFFYHFAKQSIDITNINDVSKLITELLPILKRMGDDVIRSHYICQMAQELKIKEEVIMAKMDELLYNKSQDYSINVSANDTSKTKYHKAEETILAVICVNKEIRNNLKGVDLNIFSLSIRKLVEYVLSSNNSDSSLLENVSSEYKSQLGSMLILATQYEGSVIQEKVFNDCLAVLSERTVNNDIKQLIKKIEEYEAAGNEIELEKMMQALDQMKKGGLNEFRQ
jgi:DNA primase